MALVSEVFVAPVLVLLSYALGPTPMDLSFWPGAVVMVYAVFAMTLYLLPPGAA